MTPIVAFVFISTLLFLFLSLIWSKAGWNLLIKMIFISMTLWGMLHLLGEVTPYINSGAMRIL